MDGHPSTFPHIRVVKRYKQLINGDMAGVPRIRYASRDFVSSRAIAGAIILKDELLITGAITKEQHDVLSKLEERYGKE